MDRRLALLTIGGLLFNGFKGEAKDANLSIRLDQFSVIKVSFGREDVYLSGKEIFLALKGVKNG